MPRSSQYVILLKKLIEATQQDDRELFESHVQEIKDQMHELVEEERFDLELNIKAESKSYLERLS